MSAPQPAPAPKIAAGISRVSLEIQAQQGFSLEAQDAAFDEIQQRLLADYSDQIMSATAGNDAARIKYASAVKGADNTKKNLQGKLTGAEAIDLIDKNGDVVPPSAYDVRSNGKADAVGARPRVVVREDDCVGCRLCFNVCPVEDCIAMVELPSGRPRMTWDELTQSQREVTEDWNKMMAYREKMGIHIH